MAPLIPAIALGAAAAAFLFSLQVDLDDPKVKMSGSEFKPDLPTLNRNDALSMLTRVYERNELHPGRSLGRHEMRINDEDQVTRWKVGVDDSFLHLSVPLGVTFNVKLSVPLAEVAMAAVEAQASRGVVRPDVELRFDKGFSSYLVISAATAELIMQAGFGAVKAERTTGFDTVGHHQDRGW